MHVRGARLQAIGNRRQREIVRRDEADRASVQQPRQNGLRTVLTVVRVGSAQ